MSTVAEPTVRCPRCGTLQPATLDFCDGDFEGGVCKEYLGWSRLPDADPVPGTPPPAAPPVPNVQMTVAFPGVDPAPDGSLTAGVLPGDKVTLEVTLRNVGNLVDKFSVTVQGLLPGWVQPPVGAVHLVPIGHEGHSERKLTFVLRPPRNHTARAGAWPLTIAVRSETRKRTLASDTATLVVRPFFAVVSTARPQIATGRTKARITCDVRNNGNTPITPTLLPSDAKDVCKFATPSGLTAIPPGQTAVLPLYVRAQRQLIGLPVDHQLQILVDVNGLDPPAPPLLVIFRQKPLIPWWVPVLLLALAALALAAYGLWPHKVTMPSVRGSSTVFVAQSRLQKAGIKGKPEVQERVMSNVKSGTVIDQRPAAFTRVAPDVHVVLRVAVPATYTIIPDLTGMTVGAAEDDLVRRYLKLGTVVPKGAAASAKIASQVPLPGRARSRDITAVDVVLAPPGNVKVPNIVCKTMSAAEKILTPAGLKLATPKTPVTSSQVATSQVPAAGTKRALNTPVSLLGFATNPASCDTPSKSSSTGTTKSGPKTVTTASGSVTTPSGVSAGSRAVAATDPVAFDDGHSMRLASTGDALGAGQQPAWSPDGKQLAARSGDDIRISSPGASAPAASTLHIDGRALGAPAFAPGKGDPLLAFLATPKDGSSELCFAQVTAGAPDPSCLALPRLLGRSIAWSPGGRVILVVGARPGASDRPGVIRVHRKGDAPARAGSWHAARLLWRLRLDDHVGSVFDIAYDPASARLAVVTSLAPGGATGDPRVALMRIADWPNLRDATWPGGHACQAAWNPTGTRLAVVQEAASGGCAASGTAGRLVTFAVDAPDKTATVADDARNPAWRP